MPNLLTFSKFVFVFVLVRFFWFCVFSFKKGGTWSCKVASSRSSSIRCQVTTTITHFNDNDNCFLLLIRHGAGVYGDAGFPVERNISRFLFFLSNLIICKWCLYRANRLSIHLSGKNERDNFCFFIAKKKIRIFTNRSKHVSADVSLTFLKYRRILCFLIFKQISKTKKTQILFGFAVHYRCWTKATMRQSKHCDLYSTTPLAK